MSSLDQQARSRLYMLASGFMVTKAIGTVVRWGIPELVSERPRSAAELAAAVSADPQSLHRLLRALASVGVFAEQDEVIVHTPMSRLLCRDVPGSFAAQSLMFSEIQYRTWAEAFEAFQTGEPVFARVHGSPLFDWLADHPDVAATFTQAMAGGAAVRRAPLLSRDWSGVSTVVDVGGGNGMTLVSLLAKHPALTGVVFDLPHVEPAAAALIEAADLGGRCRFAGGNFFDGVPTGADVYVLSAVLHDWDDASASLILRSVHEAMTPASRVLVADAVIAAGNEPDNAKFLDLMMLVALGGRERTEAEWRTLLSRNGFAVVQVESGLIEAISSK